MITMASARSGKPFVSVNNVKIHSSYDPEQEAEKFIHFQLGSTMPGKIILLGPGLSYLQRVLLRLFPRAEIICLFYHPFFYRRWLDCVEANRTINWNPAQTETLLSFLFQNIRELDLEGMKILKWNPAATAFPEISKEIDKNLNHVIKQKNGTLTTTHYFGKKWLKNSLNNFLRTENYIRVKKGDYPVVIAASGPYLENSLRIIKKHQNKVHVWALPSAVKALNAAGIGIDLVVATDPGYYALYHLVELPPHTPLARPLSSYPLRKNHAQSICLLSQNSFFENRLLGGANMDSMVLPPNGTVAGTALELAIRLTKGPVIFAGLDFCANDIVSHVRPHGFDTLFIQAAGRLNPLYHLSYERAHLLTPKTDHQLKIRYSLPWETYALWFYSLAEQRKRGIFRLNPSPVELNGIRSINSIQFEELVGCKQNKNQHQFLESAPAMAPYPLRKKIIQTALTDWKQTLESYPRQEKAVDKNFLTSTDHDEWYNLLFYFNLSGLMEIQRNLRTDGLESAGRCVKKNSEAVIQFLDKLLSKI